MESLLKKFSALIPDKKIDQELRFSFPERGPHSSFRPSQLYRIHLLACLKRLVSFRLLREDLEHYQSWRSFSCLKNKKQIPSLDVLSRFRQKAPCLLRQINDLYLRIIFSILKTPAVIVAVPDSTDIRAATKGFPKKTVLALNLATTPSFTPLI